MSDLRARPRLRLGALEDRNLMAGLTVVLNPDQVLTVTGTALGEQVSVVQDAGTIRVNGATIQVTGGSPVASVARSAVSRVEVYALGGNDTVEFLATDPAASQPETRMYGGSGNDTLIGGAARDVLVGGASPGAVGAAAADQTLGLYQTGGEYFNWGGWNEKWLLGDGGWHFVTPAGHVYRYFGSGGIGNSVWVSQVDPSYYADLSRLTEAFTAGEAYRLDQLHGFTQSGSEYLNYGGKNEKWFLGAAGWHFILPNGSVHRWDGAAYSATGPFVGKLDPAYHTDLSRVVSAINPAPAETDDDRLEGRAGNDDLSGGDGTDRVDGGAGNDTVDGGAHNDLVIGGDAADVLYGGTGHDTLKGASNTDSTEVNGHDRLDGGTGADELWGGTGNDTLIGGDNRDKLYGEAGSDNLWGGRENDPTEGSINWALLSTYPDDYLNGGPDSDVLHGGIGNDTLLGCEATDSLYGEAGNDTLYGAEPGSYAYTDGLNFLNGEGDDDDLYGGNMGDYLYGGEGKDGLSGGAGSNVLAGQGGADRFLTWSASDHASDLDPAAGDARIEFRGSTGSFVYSGSTYVPKDWTADEIRRVDQKVLAPLHRAASGTRLVRTSSGGNMIFNRYGGPGRGFNDGQITLTDFQLGGTDNWLQGYTLHEIGHYWNGPQLGGNRWNDFLGQSGWTMTAPYNFSYSPAGNWWYLTYSGFASNYAKESPNEDFCESFAAYFQQRLGEAFYNGTGASAVPGKIGIIAGWVASL